MFAFVFTLCITTCQVHYFEAPSYKACEVTRQLIMAQKPKEISDCNEVEFN